MSMLDHNGINTSTKEEVDTAYAMAVAQSKNWGIKKVTHPLDQHGTYCFFLCGPDENWWKILTNPEGGHAWIFERGKQIGRGHLDKDFERPEGAS